MRRAELEFAVAALSAVLLAARAFAADGGTAAPPPRIHEASLEAGVRVVVAPRARTAAGAGAPSASETVAAVVSIPIGYADDAETPGSGGASFFAGYATWELPRWSSV